MKIKKSILERIVYEELMSYFKELREDFSLTSEKEKKEDDAPEVMDADQEKGSKAKAKGGDEKAPKSPGKPEKAPEKGPKAPPAPKADKAPKKDAKPEDGGEVPELPLGDEPSGADDELGADAAGDEEEDAADVTGGKIADEVVGKSIQSLTMEPDSKTLPGAQEINITFNDSPEPLKILITKTGQVKFMHHGGLHNKV